MAKLVLITTPIGNMEDFAPRSERHLRELAHIAVEDTRSFKILCTKLGISLSEKTYFSFHDHSTDNKTGQLIKYLDEGYDVGIVSEAGSPLISDPAYPAIVAALEKGHEIDSVGSTSAVICALELSGLHTTPFHFHGFPPREKGKRQSYYESLIGSAGTHIFFEGQSRVEASMQDLVTLDPDGRFAIGRELTKNFQSMYRFAAPEFKEAMKEVVWKGEFVLLWENSGRAQGQSKLLEMANELLESGSHPKKLGKLLSEITGQPPKWCYEKLINHQK